MREYSGLLEMLYVLLWALDMLVYMGAKLYPMRHLRVLRFTVCIFLLLLITYSIDCIS